MSSTRRLTARAYFRSRRLREIAAVFRWRRWRDGPDLAHLAFYDEWTRGPVPRDEALLLHALVRALRPATVVEIGFRHGHSAFNFMRALDEDARLYSFDVDPRCEEFAHRRFAGEPRFVFRRRSQDQLAPEDVDGREVDFVFIDGAHELEVNKRTFERLLPMLSERAVIGVHDTGGLPRWLASNDVPGVHELPGWAGDEYEHQPDERAFVNCLLESHPEFSQIHLHSYRAARQGITLLQRAKPLARPG